MMDFTVIGGGYVGLSLAVLIAKNKEDVLIIDIDERKVDLINRGIPPITDYYVTQYWESVKKRIKATTEYNPIKESKYVFIAIQTPQKDLTVDFSTLNMLVNSLGKVLRKGHVLLIESSLFPTATRELIVKPLESITGLNAGNDFYVIYSPERLVPNSRRWTIENIPKLVAGINNLSLRIGLKVYRDILGLNVIPVNSIEIAEAAKLLENMYRYINIAFVNELKRFYDTLKIDFREVVEAAKTKPFGFMPFYPGPGVGGACLEKDSLLMKHLAESYGMQLKMLNVALEINRTQPKYYANKILKLAKEYGKTRLLFLGAGYKPGATTALNSPILRIVSELQKISGISVKVFDPNIKEVNDFSSLEEALSWAEIILQWGVRVKREISADKIIIDLTTL